MIAIPNMSKPKSCEDCPLTARDEWEDLYCVILTDDILAPKDIMPDCPLIEIVRCKECKWWDNNDDANRCTHESGGMWAKPNAFCSYGEKENQ